MLVDAGWWGDFLACRTCDALMNDKYVQHMWEELRREGFSYTIEEVQDPDFKPPEMSMSVPAIS
jgi:hypothetical protein